jgi:hypothetical protein
MNVLAEMIQEYIQEVFETQNIVPCDDSIYTHFQQYEPSEHIIEKEIHYFLNSYYILEDTKIQWEGDLSNVEIQVQREISLGENQKGLKIS